MHVCHNCGKRNRRLAKFCGHCGAAMSVGLTAKKTGLAVAGLVLVAGLVWGGYAVWNTRTLPARAQKAIKESGKLLNTIEKASPAMKRRKELDEVRRLNADAEALLRAGDYPAALVRAREAMASGLFFGKIVCANLLMEGGRLVKAGKYEAGLAHYKNLLEIRPGDKVAASQAQFCRQKMAAAEAKIAEERFSAICKTKSLIPAGEFQMGFPEGEGESREYLRHKVYLDAYYIDKYEVTVAQYKDFAKATGRQMPAQELWSTDHHPVVNINWNDADAYCKWAGSRLPTEAEWEKAARGGINTKYGFGDDVSKLDEYAWYFANSNSGAHPVGQKKPNQYGLYDMHGNVWEWVADWYDASYYNVSPEKNPKGPDSGAFRVLRGGSWSNLYIYLRAAGRFRDAPDLASFDVGFRCAVAARNPK